MHPTSRALGKAGQRLGAKLDAPLLDSQRQIAEYQREDDQCPVCGTERYLKPTLRLLVSRTCYHVMCESCIDRLFSSGPASCPTCCTMIRKASFAAQRFEDLGVEKEVTVRQKVAMCFNKRRENFETLLDYNNYLEEVEMITFNLINNVDTAATEERIKAYRKQNQALIENNNRRDADEGECEKAKARSERARHAAQRQYFAALDAQVETDRQTAERELLRNLSVAGGDVEAAKNAVRNAKAVAHAKAKAVASAAADARHLVGAEAFIDVASRQHLLEAEDPLGDVALYDDSSSIYDLLPKPQYFDIDQSPTMLQHQRAVVGGYDSETFWSICIRSAIQGLFALSQEC